MVQRRPGITFPNATDVVLGVVLGLFGAGTWAVLSATSDPPERDPFDSPLYWTTWIVLPVVAFGTALLRPQWPRPLCWAAALVVPSALALAVQGTVLHDADHGASLWMVGEIFIAMQGCFVLGAAFLGARLRCRGSRQ